MKLFKKISLAYTLQVFAVIILLADAAASSAGNETKKTISNGVVLLKTNNQLLDKPVNGALINLKKMCCGMHIPAISAGEFAQQVL